VSSCEYSNEFSGFIHGGELTHQLSDHQLVKVDLAPLDKCMVIQLANQNQISGISLYYKILLRSV
jgi:hypothetical protein